MKPQPKKHPAAVVLGRLGGTSRSAAKREAAKRNGAKGGRPKRSVPKQSENS